MDNEHRVEKIRKAVKIQLLGQPPIPGFLFLSPYSPLHDSSQRVKEVLEGDDAFLPFETEDQRFCLIQRNSILKVVVDADYELEVLRNSGIERLHCCQVVVRLSSGNIESGKMYIEPRDGFSRTLDELNREKGFLILEHNSEVTLLGVPHIVSVEERDTTG